MPQLVYVIYAHRALTSPAQSTMPPDPQSPPRHERIQYRLIKNHFVAQIYSGEESSLLQYGKIEYLISDCDANPSRTIAAAEDAVG